MHPLHNLATFTTITTFLLLLLSTTVLPVTAARHPLRRGRHALHSIEDIHLAIPKTLSKRGIRPRCKYRNPIIFPSPSSGSTASHTSTKPATQPTGTNTQNHPPPTSTQPTSQPTGAPGGGGNTINVKSTCGDIGATPNIEKTSGPNGSQSWLNCGLTDGGWRPQFVTIDDIIYEHDLGKAMSVPGSPFGACNQYVDLFNRYGGQFNVPPILIASFAMQESSCNPNAVGGGGEQGMMQITLDKCGDAPGGNCLDAEFNVMRGTQYFRNQLDANGGNLLKTIGNYNGWYEGMTEGDARRAASTGCCRCQQNLDYIHAMLNGWLQNRDAGGMGTFFNLAIC